MSSPLSFISERIANGQDAAFHEFPFACSLKWGFLGDLSHICGSSIINSNWVVTAANCKPYSLGTYHVVCGITDRTIIRNQQERKVDRFIVHHNYAGGMSLNDIALANFDESLTFNEYVQPIALPDGSLTEGTATVIGWGLRYTLQIDSTNHLQRGEVPIVNNDECCNLLTSLVPDACSKIDATTICAGGGQVHTCSGDSGGPLVKKVNDQWTIYGIVSWGSLVCDVNIINPPTVYTDVYAHLDFINQNI
uniref:Uncharacterized protein n=1 Tax=Phlebotomus papatasi TaxID=29031 RepID=A0A1B0DC55_PHLPP